MHTTDGRRQSHSMQSPGLSRCPWTRTFGAALQRMAQEDLEPTTNCPPITRTVAHFIQAPAQDPLVCSSTRQCAATGVGVVYRRPIGAVVTVQRVRRRLQMSRLASTTRHPTTFHRRFTGHHRTYASRAFHFRN